MYIYFCNSYVEVDWMSTCKSNNPKIRIDACNKVIKNSLRSSNNLQCLVNNSITINEIKIKLGSVLGEGNYGIAYNSSMLINNKSYDVVVKFIELQQDTEREALLIEYLSNLVINNISPHFLASYHSTFCNKPFQRNIKLFKNYKMLIMEKAENRNLMQLIQVTQLTYKDIQNIITQIFLAIYTFHQYTHCYHNDTHLGNILYMYDTTKANKYYYQLKEDKLVLNASNYLMILWDYGLAEPILNNSIYFDGIFQLPREHVNKIYSSVRNKLTNSESHMINIIHDYLRVVLQIKQFLKRPTTEVIAYLDKLIDLLIQYNNNFHIKISQIQLNTILNYDTELISDLIKNNLLSVRTSTKISATNKLSRLFRFSTSKNKNPYALNNLIGQRPPIITISNNQRMLINYYRVNPIYQQPTMFQRPYGGDKKNKKTKRKQNQPRNLSKSK